MSAFTAGKVRVGKVMGQDLPRVLALVLLAGACGPDAMRTVLVEADTTGGSVAATGSAEIALFDPDSLAAEEGSAVEAALREEPSGRAAAAPGARRAPGRTRMSRGAGEAEDRGEEAAELEDPRGDRPPPPILLPSGRVLLPSGTVLAAELRTPLHTATTVVGDRFAAFLTHAVAAGGAVVLPAGALIEGRVSHVGNASEPGTIAFLHLKAKSVRLADGQRLRLTAEVLDVTGQEVVESGRDARRPVRQGNGPEGVAAEARRATLESMLIGLGGRAIVAPASDREIIVPAGTSFTLELIEPLELTTQG